MEHRKDLYADDGLHLSPHGCDALTKQLRILVPAFSPLFQAGEAPARAAVGSERGGVTVGKLARGRPIAESDVVINRTSHLGNPFLMGPDGRQESLREAVCEAFAELIEAERASGGQPVDVDAIASRHGVAHFNRGLASAAGARAHALDQLRARVRTGEQLRLLCHCAPRRCHGDAIAAALLSGR
mmetsp:Transcript_14702/g.43139  ORF Transcript_14702/g.43139 Transcript_14702/m.43139 type:complete len:185 (+) Transcript_14702:3-557(+)